jgi:5-methylthioadenosine/S-adenosylhomocysteine deaminase
MTLLEWLEQVIWPVVPRYSYEDSLKAARLGIAENIRCGVTSIVDMNYGNRNFEAVLEFFEETGIRGFLARGFYELESNPVLLEKRDDILNGLQGLMDERSNVFPGPMHPCNVSNALLRETKDLCVAYSRPFYIHLAESEGDVQILVAREGKGTSNYWSHWESSTTT